MSKSNHVIHMPTSSPRCGFRIGTPKLVIQPYIRVLQVFLDSNGMTLGTYSEHIQVKLTKQQKLVLN
jgi:hypothetical protein